MGIRQRLSGGNSTIQDMEKALESRYYEASHLIVSPDDAHRWGGIYLLGYVGEMVLKMVYFKLKGCLPGEDAWAVLKNNAKSEAVGYGIVKQTSDFDFHNLQNMLDLVLWTRRNRGRVGFARISLPDLSSAVLALQANWWVPMRYFGERPLTEEVKAAYEAASWLRTYYFELWS